MRSWSTLNTQRGSHKPTPVIKNAEFYWAIEEVPDVVVYFLAAHGLMLQDPADEDQIAFPLDLSGVANAAHFEVTWVLWCSQLSIKLAW